MSLSINSYNFNNYRVTPPKTGKVSFGMDKEAPGEINEKVYSKAKHVPPASIALGSINTRTSLFTESEREKYALVSAALRPETKAALNRILQSGKLLNTNSNDGSSTLDNLCKILNENNPRIKGLDAATLVDEVITAIDDPYKITQKFGDIPDKVAENVSKNILTGIKDPDSIKNVRSTTCAAASLEFTTANKQPAEFARMVEGLSSQNYTVLKDIKIFDAKDSLSQKIAKVNHRKELFEMFNLPYSINQNGTATVKISPDRNAIVRARVQTSFRDKGERSVSDVLMQSAIMQIASQETYNALNGFRTGSLNNDNEGLTEYEKTFAEEIITGNERYSVIYQKLDGNSKLQGFTHSPEATLSHIKEGLNAGADIVVGITEFNKDGVCTNGHEITIVDVVKGEDGKEMFVYNDTDDGLDEPRTAPVEEMLPKIHHAGIPQELVSRLK